MEDIENEGMKEKKLSLSYAERDIFFLPTSLFSITSIFRFILHYRFFYRLSLYISLLI